jgi:hypothetical protein
MREKRTTRREGGRSLDALDRATLTAYRRLKDAQFKGERGESVRALTEQVVRAHNDWRAALGSRERGGDARTRASV